MTGLAPPSLRSTATAYWRPFAPVTIADPTGVSRHFKRALIDPGADDTVFPLEIPYRILGNAGCLEFFDVTFRGADRLVELEPNGSYAGMID